MKIDLLSVAEAAYQDVDDDQAWIHGVTAALRPFFDTGAGINGLFYDAANAVPRPPRVLAFAAFDLADGAMEATSYLSVATATKEMSKRFARVGPVGSLAYSTGPRYAEPNGIRDGLRRYGLEDVRYMIAGDTKGILAVFASPARALARLPRGRTASLARAAAHIASGLRLRTAGGLSAARVVAEGAREGGVEAILDADGRSLDAAGVARSPAGRQTLRRAAVAVERARTALRRQDPDEALEAWKALAAGRWSLVDRFDSDGRRFLIARCNEPQAEETPPFSRRERQVAELLGRGASNKLIAYTLGISSATVSTHIERIKAKVGVTSRVALAELFIDERSDGKP